MNVSCPQCKTVFRVDPRKVPADGVRARCSVCGGVFEVSAEERRAELAVAATPSPPSARAVVATPPPAATASAQEPGSAAAVAEAEPAPAADAAEAAASTPPADRPEPALEAEAEASASAAPVEPAAEKPAPVPGSPFALSDQDVRARRLARALISDLAAYHPERREKGLKEGRLKELFQDELRKSWQEYVDQVGLEIAKNTPYFRDALNEILAKGKRVF
jgi:predicted Zn finger-like uncharacterized protein